MKEEKFPYSVWPGLIALAVIVTSGIFVMGAVHDRATTTAKPKSEQIEVEAPDEPSMEDWRKKIRDSRASL